MMAFPPPPYQSPYVATFDVFAAVVAFLVATFVAAVVFVLVVAAVPVVAALFVACPPDAVLCEVSSALSTLGFVVGHPARKEDLPSSISSSPPSSYCCCCWRLWRSVLTGSRFRHVPPGTTRPAVGSMAFYKHRHPFFRHIRMLRISEKLMWVIVTWRSPSINSRFTYYC